MSGDLTVPFNFIPRDYQLELFQALDGIEGKPETKKRRALIVWPRKGGKDMTCFSYLVKEMLRVKGIYFYFLPTYQQGRKVIWEGINDEFKILDHLPQELRLNTNSVEMRFETPNGSVFRVVGTDKIDSIMGTNPTGCIFSEYSLQDPQAWEFIRPICARNNKAWVIMNGTPRGRNHMYELDVMIRDNPDWHYSLIQAAWPDKPNYREGIITQEEIERERRAGMPEDMIEQEFGCSYSAGVKGAFYASQIELAREQKRILDYDYNNHLWVDTFWDLGLNDDTVCWFRQIQGNRVIWIDYFEANNKDIAYYVDMLANKGYRYRTHYLPWDGNTRQNSPVITTKDIFKHCLSSAGISDDVVVVKRQNIQDGINAVRSRFGRFYFNAGKCAEGIRKIELYHKRWDSKKRIFSNDPVHDWCSHAADALRTEALAEEFTDDEFYSMNNIKVINDYNPFND